MTFSLPSPHRVRSDTRSDTPLPYDHLGKEHRAVIVALTTGPMMKSGAGWRTLGGKFVPMLFISDLLAEGLAETCELDGQPIARLTQRGKMHVCELLGRAGDKYFQMQSRC